MGWVILMAISFQLNAQSESISNYNMTNAHINTNGELVIKPSGTSAFSDFDFLTGHHSVHHKKLKNRLSNNYEWNEFEGTHRQESILKGIGNLEQQQMVANDGKAIEGMALRLFNPQTKLWSIYWADSRNGVLDEPVVGSFENKIGHFYSTDEFNGRPILIQFVWDATDVHAPKWSQAFSTDRGKTWEWNWYMYFKKEKAKEIEIPSAANDKISIIELRNYLLKRGKRDAFINFFEKHFISTQEERSGFPLGQYRILNEPERFFWIRGFYDIKNRSTFLPTFYYSDFWKQHRNTANEMIANNDHVHLLHPLILNHDTLVAGAIDRGLLNSYNRLAVIEFYTANEKQNKLKQLFANAYIPLLHSCGITDFTVWESELTVNDFPALPVFQDKNLLVTITFYKDEQEYRDKMELLENLMHPDLQAELLGAITIKRSLMLYPTTGSQNLNNAINPSRGTEIPFQAKSVVLLANGVLDIHPSPTSGKNDYDFLLGHHSIVHRKLQERLKNGTQWFDLSGNKTTEKLMAGLANIERHYLTDNQGKPVEAIALRIFNPKTRLWSLYWADSQLGVLDPPLVGSFEGNLGVFYGRDQFEGQEVLVQFQYDKSNPYQPVWGQAFSEDEGNTWEWNWFMFYEKRKSI